MADLEAVLADVSYLMAMEKSKGAPASRVVKKMQLPDPSIRYLMVKYLTEKNQLDFEDIFDQEIGYNLFKEFCTSNHTTVPQLHLYEKIIEYENEDSIESRSVLALELLDECITKSISSDKEVPLHALNMVTDRLNEKEFSDDLFKTYSVSMRSSLNKNFFHKFIESDKFTRYLQWKNLELSLHLTMSDFSVHRIIGRGGFGEVYGCRKTDTGNMYAMKCLDKKRIKLKRGETLPLNERHMLHMVDSPFIVCISYAFQSPDKLCFILDLMNGGDLHYHLTQRGTFTEDEVRFYGAEILLGLEHMHYHNIVYRDLKPANILLDEKGHTKISDLGLACDLSTKKPHASVGTHGYIAPEVLKKGMAYDQGADWFSYGCTLFKLLKGHSPFRTRTMVDKNEIDKMTLTMEPKMPDDLSKEVSLFIKGLLIKDCNARLGCCGRGAKELKESAFFARVDWNQAEKQKYAPPIIPPRGEVNAADAFDIGNFDDDETKGIKMTEKDQALYKDFDLIVSSRWQKEICETVFDLVNQETDKAEAKRRAKHKLLPDNFQGDCLLKGYMHKLGGQLLGTWQKKFFYLFPNRLEWIEQDVSNLVVFESVTSIREGPAKGVKQCIIISYRDSSKDLILRCETPPELEQWMKDLRDTWCLAKRVIKKGPKVIGYNRSVAEHANYNKAILAAQTKAVHNNSNNTSYRHKVVEEPQATH